MCPPVPPEYVVTEEIQGYHRILGQHNQGLRDLTNLEADSARDAAGELVEFHVEAAAARVAVALARHALVGRRRRRAAPRTVEVETCSKVKELIHERPL